MFSLFFENLKISLIAVFANKVKSLLTALGIIIGVFSVTLMGTLISGLDRSFESSMSWLGKDILYVSRYEWFSDMEWWEVKNRPRSIFYFPPFHITEPLVPAHVQYIFAQPRHTAFK